LLEQLLSNDVSIYLRKGGCFHLRLFLCLLAGLRETNQPIFTKFDGKVAHEPRKKRLDFGRNPDVTLVL